MTDNVLGERQEVWCYTLDESEERSQVVVGAREDAIAEGRNNNEPGASFLIARCQAVSGATLMPDAARLLEEIAERADDHFGEYAAEFIDELPDAARAELDQVLKAWAEKHLARSFYEQTGPFERIEAEEVEQ